MKDEKETLSALRSQIDSAGKRAVRRSLLPLLAVLAVAGVVLVSTFNQVRALYVQKRGLEDDVGKLRETKAGLEQEREKLTGEKVTLTEEQVRLKRENVQAKTDLENTKKETEALKKTVAEVRTHTPDEKVRNLIDANPYFAPPPTPAGLVPDRATQCTKLDRTNGLTANQCFLACWDKGQVTHYNHTATHTAESDTSCQSVALAECRLVGNSFCAYAWAPPSP